jgi:hypothetical protein
MPEANLFTFDHKELAEILVKHQNLHEGIWSIYFEFSLAGANVGESQNNVLPSAIVSLRKIGINRVSEITNLAVDATVVNPIKKKQ